MLAKKYRLNRRQINLIYKKGTGKRIGEIGIKFLPNSESFSRFSVIIPKAVVKKVTLCNRYRRLIFEELSKTTLPQSFDVIVRIFKISSEEALKRNVQEILRSINV